MCAYGVCRDGVEHQSVHSTCLCARLELRSCLHACGCAMGWVCTCVYMNVGVCIKVFARGCVVLLTFARTWMERAHRAV